VVQVFDDNIDGDIISLNWNGKWILKDFETTNVRKELKLPLMDGENTLILYAENLGTKPPNTARVKFSDGKKEHTIKITSDYKMCGAVTFNKVHAK
jgi:hypothetical protein